MESICFLHRCGLTRPGTNPRHPGLVLLQPQKNTFPSKLIFSEAQSRTVADKRKCRDLQKGAAKFKCYRVQEMSAAEKKIVIELSFSEAERTSEKMRLKKQI